jgi:hypothetical protein
VFSQEKGVDRLRQEARILQQNPTLRLRVLKIHFSRCHARLIRDGRPPEIKCTMNILRCSPDIGSTAPMPFTTPPISC